MIKSNEVRLETAENLRANRFDFSIHCLKLPRLARLGGSLLASLGGLVGVSAQETGVASNENQQSESYQLYPENSEQSKYNLLGPERPEFDVDLGIEAHFSKMYFPSSADYSPIGSDWRRQAAISLLLKEEIRFDRSSSRFLCQDEELFRDPLNAWENARLPGVTPNEILLELQTDFTSSPQMAIDDLIIPRPKYPFLTHEDLGLLESRNNEALRVLLDQQNLILQPTSEGVGEVVQDTYAVYLRVPNIFDPEIFIDELLYDLNATVDSTVFDLLNQFQVIDKTKGEKAEIGSSRYIDIVGPINGMVVVVDKRENGFVFQAARSKDAKRGFHPETGLRAFQLRWLDPDMVEISTIGYSKPRLIDAAGLEHQALDMGRFLQELNWRSFLGGVSRRIITEYGGEEIDRYIHSDYKPIDLGRPVIEINELAPREFQPFRRSAPVESQRILFPPAKEK